jgi:hypothetical protein
MNTETKWQRTIHYRQVNDYLHSKTGIALGFILSALLIAGGTYLLIRFIEKGDVELALMTVLCYFGAGFGGIIVGIKRSRKLKT